MSPLGEGLASIAVIVGVAAVAHEPWRWLGAYLGRSLTVEDEIFIWVKAVSTALVSGLVMRLVLFPAGVLEAVPVLVRVGALAVGVGAFYLGRRSMFIGIVCGCVVLACGAGLVEMFGASG